MTQPPQLTGRGGPKVGLWLCPQSPRQNDTAPSSLSRYVSPNSPSPEFSFSGDVRPKAPLAGVVQGAGAEVYLAKIKQDT